MFLSQDILKLFYFKGPHDLPNMWRLMSISTWNNGSFMNHNWLSHQTWPIDRYKQGQ